MQGPTQGTNGYVNLRLQSGMTLVETAVAAAIIAIAAGAAMFAIGSFGRHVAQQYGPARSGALLAATQQLRLAQNAWKYGSPGNAPSGTQRITLPLGGGATTAATVSTTIASNGASTRVSLSVSYTPQPNDADSGTISISQDLQAKAPLPGSEVEPPALIAAPTGAP